MLDDPRLSLEPVRVNDFGYCALCTDVAASWCPIHGDCTCEPNFDEAMNCEGCPLHGEGSDHAQLPPQWVDRLNNFEDCEHNWVLIPFEDLDFTGKDLNRYPNLYRFHWTYRDARGRVGGLEGARQIIEHMVNSGELSRRVAALIEIPSTILTRTEK